MSIFLGPYFFIRDTAPANFWTGVVLMVVLLAAMSMAFKKPFRIWKAVVAGLAVAIWVILGIIGEGIGA
ncbi:MAG: hypothetical protein ACO1QB_11065 [Verrucomicrobiales bacterium]